MKISNISKVIILCFTVFLIFGFGRIILDNIEASKPGYEAYVMNYNKDVSVSIDNIYKVKDSIKIDYKDKNVKLAYVVPSQEGEISYDLYNLDIDTNLEYNISKNKKELKIVFNNLTYTGEQDIKISYSLNKGMNYEQGEDYFKLNAQNLLNVSSMAEYAFTLTLPRNESIVDEKVNLKVYNDDKLEGDITKLFKITTDESLLLVKANEYTQIPSDVVLYAKLSDNYFEGAKDYLSVNGIVILVVLVITLIFFVLWFFKGKDDRLIPFPFYTSPDDLNPLEIGYYINRDLEYNEIFNMILYWANKGYIKVRKNSNDEYLDAMTKKKIGDYSFIKIKELDINAPEYEKRLFKAFFELEDNEETPNEFYIKNFLGNTVNLFATLQSYADEMYYVEEEFRKNQKKVEHDGNDLTAENLFYSMKTITCILWGIAIVMYSDLNVLTFWNLAPVFLVFLVSFFGLLMPKEQYWDYSLIAIPVLLVFSFLIINPVVLVLLLLDTIFTVIVRKRNFKYNELLGKIYGFRDVIADYKYKEEVSKIAHESSTYFFEVLPYALALGKEEKWLKKFDYIKSPSWYESFDGEGLNISNIESFVKDNYELCMAILANVNNSAMASKKKVAVEDMSR